MVLPPVVGGAALLFALGRRGVVGEPLNDATGFLLPFSTWGVVVANVFVAMPFLVITVEGALEGMDRRFEHAAASLGASPLTVFRRVTLPMTAPGIATGFVFVFVLSIGNFVTPALLGGGQFQMIGNLVYAQFLTANDWPFGAALSMFLIAIMMGLLTLQTFADERASGARREEN